MKRCFFVLAILAAAALGWADGNDAYASVSDWFGVDPNAGQNSFLTLIIPSGGKYEGMATAHTAVALDGGYMEANPAAGSFLPRTVLSFSHVDWIADSALESASFAFRPENNENMGIGFGLKFMHVSFTGYNDWGAQYSNNGVGASGWYTEAIATASFSYRFLRSFNFGGLSVGTNLKAGYRGVSAALEPGQSAMSLMGDVGLMTQFNFLKGFASRDKNFGVGLVVKNLGSEFIDEADPLPTYASLGISYRPIRPITIAFDFNYPFNLNGEPAETFSFATGLNADITSFLSAHTGVLIKTGKPRFAIGADIAMRNMTLVANYTLDLTTRMEMFDRMSVAIKVDLDTVQELILRDDAQFYYLEGLDYYAAGEYEKAIDSWNECIRVDKAFTPAYRMIEAARKAIETDEALRRTLTN